MHYWVIIETGSNQKYIFGTNKQRLQVAASAAVWRLGMEWIGRAIVDSGLGQVAAAPDEGSVFDGSAPSTAALQRYRASPNAVLHVVQASGRAVLLVHAPAHGRRIIRAVTERALSTRSGLDVWGRVGPAVADDLHDAGEAFFVTDVGLREQRAQRFSPSARFPTLPFHQLCGYTGLPASGWEVETAKETELHARSDVVDFLFTNAADARDRMIKTAYEKLGKKEWSLASHVLLRAHELARGDELSSNGWIGVLHADGNGVGKIFANLRLAYKGEAFILKQAELSAGLESITWNALRDTVIGKDHSTDDTARWGLDPNDGSFKNVILPIVVGGDDVAAALSGSIAFDFAVLLSKNFGHYAATDLGAPFRDALAAVKDSLREAGRTDEVDSIPPTLSLAVGLVFTKPHHPFSHSIGMAEELTSSAKKYSNREVGAVDTHVLFESAVRELQTVRAGMGFSANGESFSYAGQPIAVESNDHGLPTVDELRALQDLLTPSEQNDQHAGSMTLSRGQIQSLKEALTESPDRATLLDRLSMLDNHLRLDDRTIPDEIDPRQSSGNPILVQALDLIDVARGTVESRERGADETDESAEVSA